MALAANDHLATLGALAQETRLAAFRALVAEGPAGLPAGEVARIIGTPSNTMSTHLSILERSGLISSRREGRSIIYTANLDAMQNLVVYLVQDCCNGNPGMCNSVAEMLSHGASCAPGECDPVQTPAVKELA